jgi:hypothetical protein
MCKTADLVTEVDDHQICPPISSLKLEAMRALSTFIPKLCWILAREPQSTKVPAVLGSNNTSHWLSELKHL